MLLVLQSIYLLMFIHAFTSPAQGLCITECFGPYQDGEQISCPVVNAVLDCYYNNQLVCDQDSRVLLYLGEAIQDYMTYCLTNDTTTTQSNPEPVQCPSVPDIYNTNPSVSMSRASIAQDSQPPECTMQPSSRIEQCSLFMDSQLRAFSAYRNGLETCSLPGVWYLLRHQSLTIQVEGTSLELGSNHTRLTKVNVTFYSHECNPTPLYYIAYNSEPLPSSFSPLHASTNSTLQLISYPNGSVVTLLATWLNTTIIIRRYSEFLSITLQVPGEISSKSEGLCTGCPAHLYINITDFNSLIPSICPDDNDRALVNCFEHGGVTNQKGLIQILNNSYLEACVYSIYKIKSSEVLSMFNAIAGDALLLLDTDISQPPSLTTPRTTSSPFTHPYTNMSSSGISSYSSKFILLVNICVIVLLFR